MANKLIFILFVILINTTLFAQRYELQSIEFRGNNQISTSVLKNLIYSKETPWWFWKFLHKYTSLGAEPVYFDSSNIQIDLNALKEYYKANGFFRAEFSDSYKIDADKDEVYLTYNITENTPSKLDIIKIRGIDSLPGKIIKEIYYNYDVDTTKRYSEIKIQQSTQKALSIMLNNGYMFARYDSIVVNMDTLNHRANPEIYFSTGNRYTIDSVNIIKHGEGARLVSNKLLKDVTGIKKNEYYSLEELRRSQARLYRTGLFNSVSLTPVLEDTLGNMVPLRLEGNIGLLNELSPEIILNNQQNALNMGLGTSYIRKNFLGNARKLTISASFGIQNLYKVDFASLIKKFSFRDTTLLGYLDSRVIIEQPFLFGKPIYGTWETYATINKQPRYNTTIYGSKITFDFELPRFTFLNSLSTFYNVEESNEVYRTQTDNPSTKLISLVGTDFGSSKTDSLLFPTQGYNLAFHLEEANSLLYIVSKIGGKDYTGAMFYKVQFTGSNYFPLNVKRNTVFASKIKIGHLHAYYGSYKDIPLNRTFYAGGSNSVRGWRANQLTPENADTIVAINGSSIKGGTFLFEGSFEIRYRFLEDIGIVTFFDYGNTWLSYKQFSFGTLALAAGLGMRYYTPIAPFRVDLGFKFYNPSDKKFIFKKKFWKQVEIHFGIGEAF